MPRSPLVIIGAGTGGLTLGRHLQRHSIPFRIYERADELPRHNYGISLAQRTYQSLLEVLQTSEYEFRRSLAVVKACTSPTPVAERTAQNLIHTPPQGPSSEMRVNRSAFEKFLSEPIKQHIQYSSRFKSIKPMSNLSGHVSVTFESGSAVSELVIDCSGVHSPLRAALLPHRQPVIHPYVAVNGKRYLQPEIWEARYAPGFGSDTSLQITVQFEHENNGTTRNITARLEISINETVLDRQGRLERVSISYIYSRKAFPPEDALYVPSRPKQAAKDIPPQFYEEMASLIKSGKLSPTYMEAFNPANAGDDRLLSWLLRSVHLEESDTKALRDQGVLMMGDAAYAEPIVGSVPGGANHVIGQAIRLADRLAVQWKNGKQGAEMDLAGWLKPEPRSGEKDVAEHLGKIHELEPVKAVL